MNTNSSRRNFLKLAGWGLGTAILACGGCGGLGYLALQQPAINFYERQGEKPMSNTVLIAYASKCGSSGEVAEAIAEELLTRGKSVEVCPVHKITSLAGYQAVMVGSAIRMGSWLPEAVKFVEQNATALAQMPTAFFTTHMLNTDDSEASRTARASYLDAVHKYMTAPAEVYFTGKLELAKMSWLDRFISTMMKAQDEDKRDWVKIRAWAQTVWA